MLERLAFVRLSGRILLRLEQLFVDEHLIVLPHHLPLQDLPILDKPLKLLDDEDGLGGD
jgi:hypothetical protein